MTGGILQLVTNGGYQEHYLTEKPEITHFKKVYRRTTNTASDYVDILPSTPVDFEKGCKFKITKAGDLLYRVFLSCEIPQLSAYFPNTRTFDFVNSLNTLNGQNKFKSTLLQSTDIKHAMDLIDKQISCYQKELSDRIDIISSLTSYDCFPEQKPFETSIPVNLNAATPVIDYQYFKNSLADVWLKNKPQYYLAHNFLRYAYSQENIDIDPKTLVDNTIISNLIFITLIFSELIPSREILFIYLVKFRDYVYSGNVAVDSLISVFDVKLSSTFSSIYSKTPDLLQLYDAYTNNLSTVTTTSPDPLSLDSHFLLKRIAATFNNNPGNANLLQKRYYNYGYTYRYLLNGYNIFIKVLQSMATSVPIVSVKAYLKNDSTRFLNIYQASDTVFSGGSENTTRLKIDSGYNFFLDPNFKLDFIINNNDDLWINDKYQHEYLSFINQQTFATYNNIERNLKTLTTYYENYDLVGSGVSMFTDIIYMLPNSVSEYSGFIYYTNYKTPNAGYKQTVSTHVFCDNVFSLNTLYFNFFNTLFNSTFISTILSQINDVTYNSFYENPAAAHDYANDMLTALLNNINAHLTEIAYQYNGVVIDCETPPDPSPGHTFTFDTYAPPSFNVNTYASAEKTWTPTDTQNNPNYNNCVPPFGNAICVMSFKFYRHLFPTIIDFFQFIFYFLDSVDLNYLTTYQSPLMVNTFMVSANDVAIINGIMKIFYHQVLKNLLDFYDVFQFEKPASYSFTDITVNTTFDTLWKSFADSIFVSASLPFALPQNIINQLKFYFVAEFIYCREMGKMYSQTFFNDDLIKSSVGDSTYNLLKIFKKYLSAVNNNAAINMNAIDADPNRLKKYWNDIYRLNLGTNGESPLYYNVMNIYKYTTVNPPPAPSLIDPRYYSNKITGNGFSNYTNVYYNKSSSSKFNTLDTLSNFTLTDIDYFRIKHSIFFNPSIAITNPPVYLYEYCLAQMIEVTKQIISDHPSYTREDAEYVVWAGFIVYSHLNGTSFYSIIIGEYISALQSFLDFGTPITLASLNNYMSNGLLVAYQTFLNGSAFATDYNPIPTVQPPITPNEIINNTLEIQNTVISGTTDIIGLIEAMRENFNTQYYFYVKYNSIINAIDVYGLVNNKLQYKNMSELIYETLSLTNYNNVNISYLDGVSPFVFIYRDVYPKDVEVIASIIDVMDPFSQLVADLLVATDDNPMVRYTIKDINLITQTSFINMQNVGSAVAPYYEYLRLKDKIVNDVIEYFRQNVFSDMTITDINNLTDITTGYGLQSQLPYWTSFSVKYNSSTVERRGGLVNQVYRTEIDYFIIHDFINNTVTPGITFKKYIRVVPTPSTNENYFIIKKSVYTDYVIYFNQNVFNVGVPTLSSVTDLINIGNSYGLNLTAYWNDFQTIFNSSSFSDQQNMIYSKLYTDIDYYIIYDLIDNSVASGYTLISYFHDKSIVVNPVMTNYLDFIENNYYSFIEFFTGENASYPLFNRFNQNLLIYDESVFTNQYNGLSRVFDYLEYAMDYTWDAVMLICGISENEYILELPDSNRWVVGMNLIELQTQQYISEYENRYNIDAVLQQNEINAEQAKQNGIAERNAYMKQKRVDAIIAALNSARIAEKVIAVDDFQKDIYEVNGRNDVLEYYKSELQKSVALINYRLKELEILKEDLTHIIYRGAKAKTAYIRQIGCYLVSKFNIKLGIDSLDCYENDWAHLWHQLTEQPGKEDGFNKLTGNTKDLFTFSESDKGGITLMIPLIFWHCRNSGWALPLVSLIETNMSLEVQFRGLEDVTYKEKYSEFTVKPQLSNVKLVGEYIYLSDEERKHFVMQRLQYLIEQVQYDNGFPVNDSVLNKMYSLKNNRTGQQLNNPGEFPSNTLIYARDYNSSKMSVEQRIEYVYSEDTNKFGQKTMVVSKVTPSDAITFRKRIRRELTFYHPTKFMIMIVKMDKHTMNIKRTSQKEYFYGEKQYSNYTLNSWYDLSGVLKLKLNYYNSLQAKLNSDDPVYGFTNIIGLLINEYADGAPASNNQIDQWIHNNYDFFMNTLRRLLYGYQGPYNSYAELIRLKEGIEKLGLNFNIVDQDLLISMLDEYCDKVGINHFTIQEITNEMSKLGYNINNFSMSYGVFRNLVYNLDPSININIMELSAHDVYNHYNEVQNNYMINVINSKIIITDYDFLNILELFYDKYTQSDVIDKTISSHVRLMINKLKQLNITEMNEYNIPPIMFYENKNIIYHVINIISDENFNKDYNYAIGIYCVYVICTKMNDVVNNLINSIVITTPNNFLDYMKKNREVSPLIAGQLFFNDKQLMPESAVEMYWNSVRPYQNALRSPSVGVNYYSWAFNPFIDQPNGAANLTRISKFECQYDLHPDVSSDNPGVIEHYLCNYNIINVMSGLGGLQWQNSGGTVRGSHK